MVWMLQKSKTDWSVERVIEYSPYYSQFDYCYIAKWDYNCVHLVHGAKNQ